ncbi:1321_t:CDS:2 [Ambispora leptoticha]|uniref:1321_t:CDS:1 n=1 Tax=Ambispora leptoticha TaxID=144679 RepID=A0A9N8V6L1_9GLOM|nr:1321_t:CDS:2 [Ambispora leptoticha]
MIESHRDSKAKFIKAYPGEDIEKVVTEKGRSKENEGGEKESSSDNKLSESINATESSKAILPNQEDDPAKDEVETREKDLSSNNILSEHIDSAESSKPELFNQEAEPSKDEIETKETDSSSNNKLLEPIDVAKLSKLVLDEPEQNENNATIPEITFQNAFQPNPKFVVANTTSISSDVTPIVSPNNAMAEHIHNAALVTETPIYNNPNNRNLVPVYPAHIDLPPQFHEETTNASPTPFSEYFTPNFVSEDNSSSITYTSDPLEYPHQPRYPPSTGISRTQQKLMLQRQHFLADDENFLIHPRNQLRLTKVIERINREHASILLYRDPMMESIQRVMGKYARNHPEVLDEDFGTSYDDNKDWERNKNSLVPSSSSNNSNESVGQSASASANIISATLAESGKLKGK